MSNKSPNIKVHEVTREVVDSDEELYFAWWCQELIEHGVLLAADVNKKSIELSGQVDHTFELSMKTKNKKKTEKLMHGHKYTPDFNMFPDMRYRDAFYAILIKGKKLPKQKVHFISMRDDQHEIVVEIKPAFDQHNMTRLVRTNLKWTFDKYLTYINLIKVPEIFAKTFTPKKYIEVMQGKRKPGTTRIKHKITTIEEYVAELDITREKLKRAYSQNSIVDM